MAEFLSRPQPTVDPEFHCDLGHTAARQLLDVHFSAKVEKFLASKDESVVLQTMKWLCIPSFPASIERGVKLRVMNKGLVDFLRMATEAETDIAVGRWIGDYPDTDTFVHGILQSRERSSGKSVSNAEINSLAQAARVEIDPAARHAIYRRVEEIIDCDALLLLLFHEQVYRFARPEVEGLHLSLALPPVAYEELSIRQ